MLKELREHLITRKKYNTLENKYLSQREEIINLTNELKLQKTINETEKEIFKEEIKKTVDKFIKNEVKKAKKEKEVK